MVKYSIILRAYNAAEKVSESIESVIKQSYKNWELIIVDDGSTDNTGEVCEKYALVDKRIKIIHQENKGCLLATQTGVNNATGDFVCLIDSDDWYEKDYLEIVNEIVENQDVDMIVANYNIIGNHGQKQEFCLVKEDCILNTQEAIKKFLESTNYALWNKFVARKKIRYTDTEQEFYDKWGKTTNFGDDLYLLMPVLCECENIYFTSKKLYNYTIDEQSISHQSIKNHWEEIFIRNRLMEFAFNAIMCRKYMNDKVKQLIQINTIAILISNIECIIKERSFDRSKRADYVWYSIVRTIKRKWYLPANGSSHDENWRRSRNHRRNAW